MLTKSVNSVISVVLKHVARTKKIRAIGVIREHSIISEWFYRTTIAFIITTIETTIDCIVTIVSIVVYIVLLYDRVVLK